MDTESIESSEPEDGLVIEVTESHDVTAGIDLAESSVSYSKVPSIDEDKCFLNRDFDNRAPSQLSTSPEFNDST